MKLNKKLSQLFIVFTIGLFWIAIVACCCSLMLGNIAAKLTVATILIVLIAFGLLLLWREGIGKDYLLIMAFVLSAAMLLRAHFLDYASGDYNSFLTQWYSFFKHNGGFSAMAESIGDYNVPYLYFMAAISYIKTPDLYLIKLFSILFDILLAWGGFRLIRVFQQKDTDLCTPLIGYIVILMLPTVVLNGAYWGQCDAIYGALTLHATTQLLNGKNKSSVALLAIAFSFKLQTIFLIPLWGVMWFAKKIKFRELLLFPLAYGMTIIPALLMGKPPKDILGVYCGQVAEYSRLTLNAPSIFQLIPYGMDVNDKLLSALGIACAAILVFVLLGLGLWLGPRLDKQAIMTMAMLLSIGVPFLLPHMHERYFFLADTFAVCLACINKKYIPAPVLVCGSSLASYCVYLRLKYNYIIRLGNFQFVMLLEALAMLIALAFSFSSMFFEVRRCFQSKKYKIYMSVIKEPDA